jgi:hypothetical protein
MKPINLFLILVWAIGAFVQFYGGEKSIVIAAEFCFLVMVLFLNNRPQKPEEADGEWESAPNETA